MTRNRRRGTGRTLRAAVLLLAMASAAPVQAVAAERRCGWLENPTPGNFSLKDRAGEWTVAEQGSYQAQGFDDLPDLTTAGWVERNGPYGYGCACLSVETEAGRKRVRRVLSATPVPLARCRADPALPKP